MPGVRLDPAITDSGIYIMTKPNIDSYWLHIQDGKLVDDYEQAARDQNITLDELMIIVLERSRDLNLHKTAACNGPFGGTWGEPDENNQQKEKTMPGTG